MTPIVDGHLDLAFSVTDHGRDFEADISAIRALEPEPGERGHATVSLPELRRAGVAVAFATLYASPAELWTKPGEVNPGGYSTPQEAEAQALRQLEVYEGWAAKDLVRIINSAGDLEHHLSLWREDLKPGLVVLMEGADPIVSPQDLETWYARGVRIIGTSWGKTRYAGGTESSGGLTQLGRELVQGMVGLGIPLDASHQSWEAFWDSLDLGVQRIIATHSNPFALRPTTNRHLTDAMIREIGARDGMVGVVLLNSFLEPRWTREDRRVPVTLERVKLHFEHIAALIGWDRVGIGSDLDGGFGSLETPGLETIADLRRIGEIVPEQARDGVLGGNWLEWLRRNLPASS
jgi:membrane dipeptidase